MLDGEVCCLEPDGTSNFNRLLFRRDWPHFYAFDVLSINGRDVTGLPLLERKDGLRAIMPAVECTLLYLDSIAERGCDLFRVACERDLRASSQSGRTARIRPTAARRRGSRSKNPHYSQIVDRHELFANRRSVEGATRRFARPSLELR